MPLPNSMPISKSEYLRAALYGRIYHATLIDAALVLYHCEVPLDLARKYIETLESKLDMGAGSTVSPTDDLNKEFHPTKGEDND